MDADDSEYGGGPLPSQLPRHTEPPETELYRAILHGACLDLGNPKPAIRADAAAWFALPDAGWPVSLSTCCEILDLNPRKISRHALRWAGLR